MTSSRFLNFTNKSESSFYKSMEHDNLKKNWRCITKQLLTGFKDNSSIVWYEDGSVARGRKLYTSVLKKSDLFGGGGGVIKIFFFFNL